MNKKDLNQNETIMETKRLEDRKVSCLQEQSMQDLSVLLRHCEERSDAAIQSMESQCTFSSPLTPNPSPAGRGANRIPTPALPLAKQFTGLFCSAESIGEGENLQFNSAEVSQKPHNVKGLFAYSPINLFASRKIAFTLAEVLITLGIIGIVAAMTLPTLIEKNKKAELQNALKVGYSQLQQALERMHADMGYTPTPQDFAARKFKDQYIKYFESPIDCQWGGVYASGNTKLCGKGTAVTGESGRAELSDIYSIYNSTSGQKMSSAIIDDGQFALKNGMLVMIENVTAGALFITIDVNGINKRPNIWGYDVFTFQLMNDGKLIPMGAPGTIYTSETYCSKTSTHVFNGAGCTYKALTDTHYWDKI